MARIYWLILPVLLIACASDRPPPNFLRGDTKTWNDWMNTIVSVDLTNVPLDSLSTRVPFEGMNVVFTGIDPEYRIALQAQDVTRRQALWMLANQYGLAMFGSSNAVVITNREIRRENRPRP